METLATGESFLFEGFRLDRRGLFRRDVRGVSIPVAIGSRAFDLLRMLITTQGDFVSKDELMAGVWPGTVVDDKNLTVQISTLRRILDQGRAEGSCIHTVAGRGYRFVATVTRCAVDMDRYPRDLSRTGVEPSVALADGRSPELQPSPISSAERRQLTVMICDLVGASALAARLDPEDLREIIAAYHRAIAEIAATFDGLIGKSMSDRVMVYFGFPRAHEDDAERAVRAGLGAIDAVGRLDAGAGQLQTRVGIATGLVVVGDPIDEGPAREQSIVGEAPHLAAGLQALAQPDTVVIAAGTRRLVGALFEYRDLGVVAVQGIVEPVPAWQVLRPGIVASRFEALRGSALSPLVGRDEEIDLLLRRWARAKAGDGQIVLISGEPGIGKSRIAAALEERLHAELPLRSHYFCAPYRQDSALFPFIDQLGRAAGFRRDDMPAAKLEKLEALLTHAEPPDEDVTVLADLLSLPASGRHPLSNLSPQRKKDRTLEALLRQLEGLARQQPAVMVFEDVHWIDLTSRELLDLFVERVRSLPVLLIVTYRPEFQPPWTGQPQVSVMSLNRLDRRDRTTLVTQIAGGKALPADVIDQIADRTDGVPLFVEELTKTVLESGLLREEADRYALEGALPPLSIPTTLHASLMARLDRLGPAPKRVAQIGAAIGREFSYGLLLAFIDQLSARELNDALHRLVEAGLLFQRGAPPTAAYVFKHALVQDTAYGTLLRGARQDIHRRIAQALEAQFPHLLEMQPEIAAHHFAEAAEVERSVTYWRRAGELSVTKSAVCEAMAQLRRGLDLLKSLPESRDRKRLELDLHITLTAALMGARGYADREVSATLERSRQLVTETGGLGTPLYFSVLYGIWVVAYVGGRTEAGLHHATEFLSLAEAQPAADSLSIGHRILAASLMQAGDYWRALPHGKMAVSLYRLDEHRELAFRFGQDIGASALCYLSWGLWHAGYPDQAMQTADRAVLHAREFGHAHTLVYTLWHVSILAVFARDAAKVERLAKEASGIAAEYGFPLWSAHSEILLGWVAARWEQAADGIVRMRAAVTARTATGARLLEPLFLGLIAEGLMLDGRTEESVVVLDEALAVAAETGDVASNAGLRWLQGELLQRLGTSNAGAAEAAFGRAVSEARRQGSRGYELRAATSLARLWRDQGRRTEARDLLASVYGWFTEGFDTPDLKEAKALLDELGW
jgi:class 3 adenylate cyclase/predicted ATPase